MRAAPKSILIVDVDYLGDAILALPVVPALRRHFPTAQLTLAASREVAPLLLSHPDLDRVVELDARRRLRSVLRLVRQFFNLGRHELVIGLSVIPGRDWVAAVAAWFCGARRRLSINRHEAESPLHWSSIYFNVLRPLGIEGSPEAPHLPIHPWARQKMQRLLQDNGSRPRPWVGLNPGGRIYRLSDPEKRGRKSVLSRRWPLQDYATLSRRLIDDGVTVFLTGSKEDISLAATIIKQASASGSNRLIDMTGRLSLAENIALIEQLDVFVSGDTGPMHVAIALDVATVAILGPSDPRRIGPRETRAGHQILTPNLPCSPCSGPVLFPCRNKNGQECLNAISIETVYQAVCSALRFCPPARLAGNMGARV